MIQRVVESTDNIIYPVTNLLDKDGNETADVASAVMMVVYAAGVYITDEVCCQIHTLQ